MEDIHIEDKEDEEDEEDEEYSEAFSPALLPFLLGHSGSFGMAP